MMANLLLASIISTQQKLMQVNIFIPVTKLFCPFVARQASYFAKGGYFRSLVSSGGFSKKPTAKIVDLRKKGREKKKNG